ncbi:hypothetical protein C5167_038926 [Papaver somniferum]|uniref:FBD domain-containing protein n=1 Tax=Papaver somniferum TaxID=3469 RepID=A0A4Y7IF00_PAPSO|nr:hypothetical protein C5167_038926 [Papaver somniferum]
MFIDSLAFDDEKLTKQFFSSCPLLERLVITNCEFPEMDLNFSFPELWEFDLVKCSGSSKNGRQSVDSKIILCVPKLQHFLSNDYMSRNYHLGDMPSLVVADLYNNYELDVDDDDEAPEIDTELPAGVKELYVERLNKFFRVVHNVEDLTLSCLSLEKRISEHPMYPYFDEEIKVHSADVKDYWKVGLSLPAMLNHLKAVEIEGIEGRINELMFVELLLRNSIVLEELVLFSCNCEKYCKKPSDDKERRMKKFSKRLLKLPKAFAGSDFVLAKTTGGIMTSLVSEDRKSASKPRIRDANNGGFGKTTSNFTNKGRSTECFRRSVTTTRGNSANTNWDGKNKFPDGDT